MTFTQIVTKKSLFENFPKGDNIKVTLNRKVMQEYNGQCTKCVQRGTKVMENNTNAQCK